MAAADWFGSAAVAEPLPPNRRRQPPRRPTVPPRPRRRRSAQRRVRGHIVWMTAFALLLAGVVAVNVAVLRANVAVHRLDQKRAKLEAQNETLASKLSEASSAPKIEAQARRLGLVEAPAASTSYLDLAPHRH
jgi:cell division protein FtsL